MDLTNTTDGITDLPTSRDNWKTSAAERRPKGPLDSKVTLKNKSLIRNNCGNNREDRDTIDTSRSSSRSQISTSGARTSGAIPDEGRSQSPYDSNNYDVAELAADVGCVTSQRASNDDQQSLSCTASDVESTESREHVDEEISIRRPNRSSVKVIHAPILSADELYKERERLEREINDCRAKLECMAREGTDGHDKDTTEFRRLPSPRQKASTEKSYCRDRNDGACTSRYHGVSTRGSDDNRRMGHCHDNDMRHPTAKSIQPASHKCSKKKQFPSNAYCSSSSSQLNKQHSVHQNELMADQMSDPANVALTIRSTNQLQDWDASDNFYDDRIDDHIRVPRRRREREHHRHRRRRSSTSMSEDSDSRSHNNHRTRTMRPDKFNGTSTSLETFLVQFSNCASYCRWTEEDKLAYLRWSLTGTAAQLLWGTEDLTYEQLVERLKCRFGGQGMEERFQTELRCRRRKNGESLRELAQDIRRLMMLAYPGEKTNLSEHIARDFFLSALDDPDLELKIREREPPALDSAVKIAQRLEVFKSAVGQSSNTRQRLSRQVTETAGSQDSLEDRVARIERDLQDKQPSDVSTVHNQSPSELRKGKGKFKQRACATSVDSDREWKDKLLKKISDLENAQRVSEAQSKKFSAENDALQKEVGRLRHLEQLRAVPQTTEPRLPCRVNDAALSKQPRKCYNCGEPGHFFKRCPHPPRSENNNEVSGRTDPSSLHVNGTCENTDQLRSFHGTYLRAMVGNRLCNCLLDTGSDVCIIPASLVDFSQVMNTSRTLKAANGTVINTLGEITLPFKTGPFCTNVTGLVSDHVMEVMLGIDWMVANNIVWNFGHSLISIGAHSFTLISRSDKRNWCRRVVLQENITIPARSETDVPTKVVFHKLPTASDNGYWGTEPSVVEDGIHVSRTLLPCNRWSDLPIRVMNVSSRPVELKSGSVVANLQPLEVVNEVEGDTRRKTTLSDQTSATADNDKGQQKIPEFVEYLMRGVDDSLPESASLALSDILKDHADVFSQSEYDLGRTNIISHHIDTTDARPVRQPLRRYPPAHLEAISTHVDNMLNQGIIEPASSPWASNIVLVRKKDGSLRCCIDYRQLNSVTRKDAYPLPRIDSCLDAMSSARWFSTFDLRSSYHQVSVDPNDKDKTAFICPRGMYRYKTMPFGLCNAGATFQRLMDVVMSGLHLEVCLVYLDDIILFSSTVDEHLERLVRVLNRLRSAGLKLKPEKCSLFQKSVSFLGHIVSEHGIATDPAKTEAVANWPTPTTVKEVRSFLGLAGYYRRFVKNFAQIAGPLNALTRKGQAFTWTPEAQASFEGLKILLTSPPILAMPNDSDDIILDTDACDRSIGAILHQIQNGTERVIAYASRSLDRRELNYCVTRKELLAIVYSVKYFRQYLLGRSFKIRTDHAALKWLRRTPDPVGQQARWLEILEEYDFQIEHRSGVKHQNADALSRRPCAIKSCACRHSCEVDSEDDISVIHTVATIVSAGPADRPESTLDVSQSPSLIAFSTPATEDVLAVEVNSDVGGTPTSVVPSVDNGAHCQFVPFWSPEGLREAQNADSDISYVIDLLQRHSEKPPWKNVAMKSTDVKTLWNMWPRLQIREGILYRRFESIDGLTVKWQVVLPASLREEFLVTVHGGMTGGHLARRRTAAGIQSRAYWPTWSSDLDLFLRRCSPCARYHRGSAPRHATLQPSFVGEPWERVSVDITGPHPRSLKSNKYILTLVDHFSKWAEAIPLPNHTAPVVARALVIHVFSRFGTPRQLLTDRGSEFESQLFQRLMEWMEIDKLRTTVFKPSTNGAVERFHRTLNSMLGKVVSESQRDWDEQLPLVLAAYRGTVHSSTGFSPNRLFLGREVRMPIDLVMGISPEPQIDTHNFADYVTGLQNQASRSFELARRRLGAAAERRKATYDVRAKGTSFNVGEWVWYWYPRRYRSKSSKWQKNYIGPYLIVRIIEPVNCVLQKSPKAKPFVVHFDKLKKCFEQTPQSWLHAEPATDGELGTADNRSEHDAVARGQRNTRERQRFHRPYTDSQNEVDDSSDETDTHTVHSRRPRCLPRHLSDFVVDF